MGDSVLTTTNTTSNRFQEPDQSGSYVLAMSALQGGFRGRFPPVFTLLQGFRISGYWWIIESDRKRFAGFKSADSFLR
jgi:hypothetical protein